MALYSQFRRALCLVAFLCAQLFSATSAQASLIVGGSDLFTNTFHPQISTWLNEGPLVFTNIYDKSHGDNAEDFYSAVSDQGRTVTLIEIFNDGQSMVIGGYNPFSWLRNRAYTRSTYHTAFLFNLTFGEIFRQARDIQTYTAANYGPTFGAGHDLYINASLTGGYANIGHSYGDTTRYGDQDYHQAFTGSYNSWQVGAIEVFTIAPLKQLQDKPSSVSIPEPSSLVIIGIALLIFGGLKMRKGY